MVPSGFVPELKNPKYPCDTDRPKAVGEYLSNRNFLERDECVLRLALLDPEARNATWRVETSVRSFVVKQFRPWPVNGRAAPPADERFRAECQFYRTARIAEGIGRALPAMLHHDSRAGCVILEDSGTRASDGVKLTSAQAEALGWFLVGLHHHSQSVPAGARYRNRDVVGWQMAHLFQRPARRRRGVPGERLARLAAGREKVRYALEDAMAVLEKEGASLVHGDFTAANWLRTPDGSMRVVDAEFSFFGPPEFDAGAFVASLLHTRQAPEVVAAGVGVIARGCLRYHPRLTAAFAAVHLCALLDEDSASGTTTVAMLRRVAGAIEAESLEALAPIRVRRVTRRRRQNP
jgi:5-methylthioribose kinase